MLGKMLVHGLVAAAIVGGTAAVYVRITDSGNPSPQVAQTEPATVLAAATDNFRPAWTETRGTDRDRERSFRSDSRRDRHDREHDHDDDDD
ncbi:MAG: hypothetical protein AB1918_17410 [Pseudomonadota bacterium]